MISFLRNIANSFVGNNEESDEYNEVLSDDQLLTDAFNDLNQHSDQTNGDLIDGSVVDHLERVVDEDNDGWNEDWDAFEDKIDKNHKHLHLSVCKDTINGVVTQVISDNEIIIDEKNRCKFSRCTYGPIETGDLVHVESNENNEMIVKPLRYKILTGKITGDESKHNRFIFGRHAYIRKTSDHKNLRVGDIIKVLVFEIRNNIYTWRAVKYSPEIDPSFGCNDEVKEFTNQLLEDKYDINIIENIDFGDMKIGTNKSILVWIKNKGSEPQTLESVDIEEGENQVCFTSFQTNYNKKSEKPYLIPPKAECYVELTCDAKYCGDHNDLVIFKFIGFRIGRFTSVTVHEFRSRNEKHISGNRSDTTQSRYKIFGENTWILPGERVWNPTKHIHDRLERYSVPEKVWRAIENNWEIEKVFESIKQPLSKDNYQSKFHAMIYLEECENTLNIRSHDMENVKLRTEGRFLVMDVPGLSEGRPSLIISDKVICINSEQVVGENGKKVIYEGFIHGIRKDEILVRFNEKFHNEFSGGYFRVSFQLSRMLYRRCHHAIDLAPHMVEQVLFPIKIIMKKPFKHIPIESINWVNKSLNQRQKLAVVGSLRGECRPTPYIIFGPPGTGKTVTIVESILQVFINLPQSRIIACTAANSSADLIVTKLLESGKITSKDLIRISAFHRLNAIPDAVKEVTNSVDEDEKKWLYHRIIVTTSSLSGVIFKYKISPSHITHVFIDEAAQCTEPESLIPISMSVIGHGCVVLAGDHKQLGPVIMSQKAKHYQLSRSLMERLMNCCKPYERSDEYSKYGFYNPKLVTKLITNYRSNEKIMAIPSELFYQNELIFTNKTDDELIEQMGFKFSVVFTGVKGQTFNQQTLQCFINDFHSHPVFYQLLGKFSREDKQEPDCPSWYNPQEIIQCCSYLEKLYKFGVKVEDIGIITPYRKQVMKLKAHLRDMGIQECKIATIEEFQGDERRVIIVSMVRTREDNIIHDMKYNLGFVHNAKRFNVAVSRAMSLLICIGDPNLLSRDKCWDKLTEYCLRNNSYTGCKYKNYASSSTRRRFSFKE